MADNKATAVNFDNIGETSDNKDGQPKIGEFDSDAFFKVLEQQVNGQVYNAPAAMTGNVDNNSEGDNSDDKGTVTDAELEALRKRYEASSAEGKRLSEELKTLKEYEPVINAIRNDPKLTETILGYLNNGPSGNPQGLQLPEDFIFNMEDALSDPNSESAKYFGQMVDQRAKTIVDQQTAQQTKQFEEQRALQGVKEKFDLNDDQVRELIEYANSRPLRIEDVYYLKQREDNNFDSKTQLIDEQNEQRRRMQNTNTTLAGVNAGGKDTEIDPNKKVFGAILAETNKGAIFGG